MGRKITENPTKEQLGYALEVILSLEERGALDIYMTQNSPKLLYRDILNPLIKELEEKLLQWKTMI